MLNQARIDGLLGYMEEIGLSQMLIRNPVLIRYFVGIQAQGSDRATLLYVSRNNGVKLLINELTNYPKELGLDQEFHGDQDNVAEVISRYTLHDEPLGFDGEYPARWSSMQPVPMWWATVPSISSAPTRTPRKSSCSGRPAA